MFDRQLLSLAGIRPVLVFVALLSLVRGCLIVGQAYALSVAIVNVWAGEPVWGQLPFVVAFMACFVLREVVRSAMEKWLDGYAHRTASAMRERLISCLYDNASSVVARFGSGAVSDALVSGVEKAERYIALIVPKTIALVVVPLVLAVAIFSQDVTSGIIVGVCYPFIIVFMRLIGYTASDESAKRHDGFVAMSNHFLDALRGMRTLKAFGISRRYADSVYVASERYREMVMKTLRIATLSSTVLDIFATCGLAAVAIMLGFRLVEGTVAFLPALVVLMLVPEYFLPVKAYAADYHAALDGKSALQAIAEMCQVERRTVSRAASGPVVVAEGEKVAIVGKSGAGKTTLLDAIAGLVDVELGTGADVCGMPASRFGEEGWQCRVAYIPQRPHIFSGTLRDNVAFYDPTSVPDEVVLDVLARVGLARLVEELPEGLDARIGHGGRELSGGEAHRVALARALADGRRSVWLLDEPGSNLDIQTELELKQSILPLMEGRTVLVATHRLHWLGDVDRVIDLDAGTFGCERPHLRVGTPSPSSGEACHA